MTTQVYRQYGRRLKRRMQLGKIMAFIRKYQTR